jgi:hypothetical protein
MCEKLLVMRMGRAIGAGTAGLLMLVGAATPGAAAEPGQVMSLPADGFPKPVQSVVTGAVPPARYLTVEAADGESLRVRTAPHDRRDSVRCGYGPGRRHGAEYRTRAVVGDVSTVAFGSPTFYELAVTRPSVRPEHLPVLAGVVARSSIAVPVDEAQQLLSVKDFRRTLHSWQHDFDGVSLRGRLFGSLASGFTYSLSSDRAPAVAFGVGSIGCHRPGVAPLFAEDATYFPFVVPQGEYVTVNGERVRDVVRDPYLQGSWAMAVARKGDPARVSFFTADGRRLYSSELEFVPARIWRND